MYASLLEKNKCDDPIYYRYYIELREYRNREFIDTTRLEIDTHNIFYDNQIMQISNK